MSNNHLIHELILNLNLNSKTQDLGGINEEINPYKNEVLKIISEYFNAINIVDEILIDDLQIDIGKFSDLDELREKIVKQLDSQIAEILKKQKTKTHRNSDFENQLPIDKSNGNNPLSIILHFLKTGNYLWDFQKIDFKNKEIVAEYSKILSEYIHQNSIEDLLKQIIESPSFFWRLHFYFPKLTIKITEKIKAQEIENKELTEKLWKDLLLIFSKIHAQFSNEIWRQFFQITLANHQRKIENENYFTYFILLLIKKDLHFFKESTFNENQSETQFVLGEVDRKSVQKYLAELNNSIEISAKLLDFKKEIPSILKEISKENLSLIDEEYAEKSENILQKHLPNCGIIFLHAYLSPFFEEQKLLADKKFKNRTCQLKAIQLLLYLSTSKNDYIEDSEITFFKILVEIPIEDFIVFPKSLTKKEKTDCEIVLQSLIEHWSVLKKTSIETLQNQFIQRKGLVAMEEKSIEIHLEKSGVDILLEHFPFNYSIIKLSWLQKLLITVI